MLAVDDGGIGAGTAVGVVTAKAGVRSGSSFAIRVRREGGRGGDGSAGAKAEACVGVAALLSLWLWRGGILVNLRDSGMAGVVGKFAAILAFPGGDVEDFNVGTAEDGCA